MSRKTDWKLPEKYVVWMGIFVFTAVGLLGCAGSDSSKHSLPKPAQQDQLCADIDRELAGLGHFETNPKNQRFPYPSSAAGYRNVEPDSDTSSISEEVSRLLIVRARNCRVRGYAR